MKNLFTISTFLILLANSAKAEQTDSISYFLSNYQPEKALELINNKLDTCQANTLLFYQKAKSEKILTRYNEAIHSAQMSISLDSTLLPVWFLLADLQSINGHYGKSIKSYKYILSIYHS